MATVGTVASAIGQLLADCGARKCFAVTGSANFQITHALREAGVQCVLARHEGNAVTMADAYARSSPGELTLVSIHSGPGLTNAVTGIAEAAKSRTPLVVLTGDVTRGAVRSNFAIEQAELARSVWAVSERLHTPETALADVVRAVQRALHGRQTVVLSMPIDVQHAILPHDVSAPPLPAQATKPVPTSDAIAELADALDRSKRPLIMAGRGAYLSGAKSSLLSLADNVGALLATSACAHGIFAESPWSLGISGGFASPAGVELISESDLLLGFGVSFTPWTTRNGRLIAPDAFVAQVDIDSSKIGYQRNVSLGVVGDADTTARELLAELKRRKVEKVGRGWRTDEIMERIASGSHHNIPYDDTSTRRFIDPRTLTMAIDKILPIERTVVTDAGHSMGWPPLYLKVPDERGFCFTQSFQSIGLGLAGAIGSAVAQQDRLVVLGTGDGGFMMSISDLETAVRLGLRMCILIYNDSSYSAEVHYFKRLGFSTEIVEFPEVDFASIARGYGAEGVTVRSLEDLEAVRGWVESGAAGVFVIDGKVNPDLEAEWHIDAFAVAH